MKQMFLAALAAALFLLTGPVPAQVLSGEARTSQARADMAQVGDVAQLLALARQYEAEEDWGRAAAAWERASILRPHNGIFQYQSAANFALAGELSHAYNALLLLQGKGYGFELEADQRLANLHGTRLWEHLVELNNDALTRRFGDGEVAFELPPADLLLESIAWDPRGKSFLLGSARDGVIYRLDRDGALAAWSEPTGESWWSIFDIKVDAPRNLVWATTAAVPHFKGFKPEFAGRAALLKIDLRSGHLIEAYPAPDDGLPHILNGIAVSSRGQVVVAEGMRGQLFILQGEALAPLMAQPQLNALRGLTFSADDKVLYFADYERGLFGLDVNARTAFDLKAPSNVTLGGIEGVYQYEGQLIVIQNGIRPQRVIRMKLDEAGHAVALAVPIEANREAFGTPTLGTLGEDGLYFIANSQRALYDGYGLLKGGEAALPPLRIYRSDPRFNWDFEPPRLPEGVAPRAPGR